MNNYDFTNKIIIGNTIGGRCGYQGFNIELLKDSINLEIIYKAHIKYKVVTDTDRCPESSSASSSISSYWILVENVPASYNIVFQQDSTIVE